MILTERVTRVIENLKSVSELGYYTQVDADSRLASIVSTYVDFTLMRNPVRNPYNPRGQLGEWIAFGFGKAKALRISPNEYLKRHAA